MASGFEKNRKVTEMKYTVTLILDFSSHPLIYTLS